MCLAVTAMAVVFCSASQTPPSFGVSVEVVHLDVFVSHGDEAVRGLSSANFQVLDNGVLQKVEVVSQEDAPLHAILLLDTSHSVAGVTFSHLKAAGQAFLEGLGERDLATLLTFAYDIRLRSGPAAPPAAAAAAIDRASARGTTAVHDAVFTALKLADPRHGRPVVLLFSDGLDRLSYLSAEKVLQVARETDATIFVVFLTARLVNTGPGLQPRLDRPSDFLRDLAKETGGQVWTATAPQELREKFLQILSQLKNRYVLRFEPRGGARPGWHELEVKLKGRKGKVRARRGYHRPPGN